MKAMIHEVPPPGDGDPHPLFDAFVALDQRLHRELFGHDDFHDDAWHITLTPTEYYTQRAWVALRDGASPDTCRPEDAVGIATVKLPLKEDTHRGEFLVGVPLAHRSRGIGSGLFERVLDAMEGRTVLQTWTTSPEMNPTDVRAVVAASGSGALDGTAASPLWLLHRGFVLEQAERYAMLDVSRPGLLNDIALLERTASGVAASDYELLQWVGPIPEALHDAVAALYQRFSIDEPSAGLDLGAEVWDAARVAAVDARLAQRGRTRAYTTARHRASGRLVALTEVAWPQRNPQGVWQEVTLVEKDHRGHRLGLWIKSANLRLLHAHNPLSERVHTWNAEENTHIRAINQALGFRPLGLEGAWQKRL